MVDESWEWRIEEARMFWARGEHITAKYLMRTIIDKLEKVSTSQSVGGLRLTIHSPIPSKVTTEADYT